MPPKNPTTISTRPIKPRQSAAERRAAELAAGATKQSELKREAAERRLAREARERSALAAHDAPGASPGIG